MSRLGTFSRRAFIVGSVAVAGGVAFGTWEVTRTPPNPLTGEPGTALNPWVLIDARGVTVIVPRAEMGQGVQTTLAALVAEELEVPLAELRIEHGPPAQAYANEALMMGRDYGAEPSTGLGATLMHALPRVMKLQVTGGSTTLVDAYDRMRHAGAAAREVLLLAGADRLGLGIDQLRAEAGFVIATDGTRLSYSALAEDAARLTPPKAPRLKRPADWKLLGRSLPRLDHPAKATGTATYGIDVRLPDMLFATVRMNPRLGGGIERWDAAMARSMAGVEAVVDLGTGFAVVATNTWLAMQAAEMVEVDWGPAPYPETTEAIFARIAEAFDGAPNITARSAGDPDSVTTGTLVEAEYTAPYLAHATMEPMNATALVTEDGCEIWAGNQAPIMLQTDVAKALGLSADRVIVHTTIMGGGFGRRANVDFGVLAARVAAALPGRAVQLTWSREEDMTHDRYRPGAVARFAARLEAGRPMMLTADIASASLLGQQMAGTVPLPIHPADRTLTEGAGDQPYAVPHIRVRAYAADVAIPLGYWRSVGNSHNAFFHESFIDELAHAAGLDPLAYRLELVRPEHEPSAQVLEKVAEISRWTGKRAPGVGRGVALTHSFGTPVAEVVEVVDEGGRIRISNVWIAADPGLVLDPGNVESQLTGGAIFGLSAALWGEVTFADGMVEQSNFPDTELLRMHNTPRFTVALTGGGDRPQGIGEPGTPPAAPALANALFDLTGTRARRLPLAHSFDFLV